MNYTKAIDMAEKRETVATWNVENVVCTCGFEFNEKIDLNQVARAHPDTEYNPERFPGLIKRFSSPKAVALIFTTGKIVMTGLRSPSQSIQIVEKLTKIFEKARIAVNGVPEVTVQNYVSSGKLEKKNGESIQINLDSAAIMLDNVTYEPEVFPGAIYRVSKPKVVILLFSTGRFVVTGARKEGEIQEAVDYLVNAINDHDLDYNDIDEEFYY